MITASIVVYKTPFIDLKQLFRSITNSQISLVFVIDNSPSNELSTFFEKIPFAIYRFGQGNVGYGAGHNIAIREAVKMKSQYHIVLNPDLIFDASIIAEMANYMNSNKVVGQLLPKVFYPDGEIQYLCKLLPTPLDLFGRRFVFLKTFIEKRNSYYEMRQSGYEKEMIVPFLSGCFMFLRTEALEKVDGFDDSFFMYCEDIDICRRIALVGYDTVFYPYVSIIHAHRKESFKNMKMLFVHIKSAIYYFNKWGWFFDKYRKERNKFASQQYI